MRRTEKGSSRFPGSVILQIGVRTMKRLGFVGGLSHAGCGDSRQMSETVCVYVCELPSQVFWLEQASCERQCFVVGRGVAPQPRGALVTLMHSLLQDFEITCETWSFCVLPPCRDVNGPAFGHVGRSRVQQVACSRG